MSTDNKQSLPAITLAAIGVVYGDIGTSPLYTLRECLSGQFGFGVERDAVFGFLSLIFWLLILVVSVKYLSFVMRADNAGEGGILTLMSLAGRNTSARMTSVLVIIGLYVRVSLHESPVFEKVAKAKKQVKIPLGTLLTIFCADACRWTSAPGNPLASCMAGSAWCWPRRWAPSEPSTPAPKGTAAWAWTSMPTISVQPAAAG